MQINTHTINTEIKAETTNKNQVHKKTATLHKVPINNQRIIWENSPPIKSKVDNQEESPRQNKSTDGEKEKIVFILGDSWVKHVKGWNLTQQLNRNQNVYVPNFPSVKFKCMKDSKHA